MCKHGNNESLRITIQMSLTIHLWGVWMEKSEHWDTKFLCLYNKGNKQYLNYILQIILALKMESKVNTKLH